MRILHLADLHFGKSMDGISLLEQGDQPVWAERFLALAEAVRPDAVVIAGDVYDRGAPSGDAVQLLSGFLTRLSELEIPVMMVSGNHDSPQRLAFAGSMLARTGLHIAPPLADDPALMRVTLHDAHGPVHFWLMPYVFPALVSRALEMEGLNDYDAAVRALIGAQGVDFSERNVIVAHQNVTSNGAEAERGGSETMVGGVGQVDYTAFDGFEYAALGHIHAACAVGRPEVRYAGSPLCYHFNELRQPHKGPVLVTLGEKGTPVGIETLSIPPLHPLRELRGSYEALREAELAQPRRGEYLRVVLTDCRVSPEVADFFGALARERDSRVLELASEYAPFGGAGAGLSTRAVEEKSAEALFADFYAVRSGGSQPDDAALQLLAYAGECLRRADPAAPPDAADVEGLIALAMRQEGDA